MPPRLGIAVLLLACIFTCAAGLPTLKFDIVEQAYNKTNTSEPLSFSIDWSSITSDSSFSIAVGDRIEAHLPGFFGSYNPFGALSPSSATATPSPSLAGLRAELGAGNYDNTQFDAAEWNPLFETLKVKVAIAGAITGIHMQENYLRLRHSSSGDPNGLGPIPPKGGVREEWPKLAYVRAFSASSCTGGAANRPGLSPEVCKGAPKWQFSSVTQGTYNLTNNTVLLTEGEGFAGTMTKAKFTKATILANNTVAGGRNCISVSLVSNIAMVSTSSTRTRFSISGLRGSSFNSGEIPLYADVSQCLKTPPVPGLGAGSVGKIISAGSNAASDTATWDKDEGTLTFELSPGHVLQAGQTLSFVFALTNSPGGGAGGGAKIGAAGVFCRGGAGMCGEDTTNSKVFELGDSDMVAGTLASARRGGKDLTETAGGVTASGRRYNPLDGGDAAFTTRNIAQKLTDPDVVNYVHATISSNRAIGIGAEIKLEGVCISPTSGSTGTSTASLVSMFDAGESGYTDSTGATQPQDAVTNSIFEANARWSGETLTITTKAEMLANIPYGFAINFRNRIAASPGCTPSISAVGEGVSIPKTAMVGSIGIVDAPVWKTAKIGQVSTRPNTLNYICITLKPNTDFTSTNPVGGGSTVSAVTITGLKGSAMSSGTRFVSDCPTSVSSTGTFTAPTTSVNGLFKPFAPSTSEVNTFAWNQETGTATLQINTANAGLLKTADRVFAIPMLNPKAGNPCQKDIQISSSGSVVVSGQAMTVSSTDRAILDGKSDGDACPLLVYGPRFVTARVVQSTSEPLKFNTITATLRSNFAISRNPSAITISGLTGSMTAEGSISILSGSGFTPKVASAAYSGGVVTINLDTGFPVGGSDPNTCPLPVETTSVTVNGTTNTTEGTTGPYLCMAPGVDYVFRFELRNGEAAQAAPKIQISATYQTENGQESAGTVDNEFLYDAGRNPMFIARPAGSMVRYNVGQRTPSPGVTNAICVTLMSAAELASSGSSLTSITIKGLPTYFAGAESFVTPFNATTELSAALSPNSDGSRPGNMNAVGSEIRAFVVPGKTLAAHTNYTMCIQVRNPEAASRCATVQLAVTVGEDSATYTMKQDEETEVFGYGKGAACAGFVSKKKFLLATARARGQVVDTYSTYIMEFMFNAELESNTVITVGGLRGYAPASDKLGISYSRGGKYDSVTALNTAADWSGSELKFTFDQRVPISSRRAISSVYSTTDIFEIVLSLWNGKDEQSAPVLTASAPGFDSIEVDMGRSPVVAEAPVAAAVVEAEEEVKQRNISIGLGVGLGLLGAAWLTFVIMYCLYSKKGPGEEKKPHAEVMASMKADLVNVASRASMSIPNLKGMTMSLKKKDTATSSNPKEATVKSAKPTSGTAKAQKPNAHFPGYPGFPPQPNPGMQPHPGMSIQMMRPPYPAPGAASIQMVNGMPFPGASMPLYGGSPPPAGAFGMPF